MRNALTTMHGLVTIHKLNQQNAEAERIMQKHAAADAAKAAEQIGAGSSDIKKRVAISDPQ